MAAHPAPDPGRGVFETLLALEGAPVEAEAHLARLAASVRALYGAALPDGTAAGPVDAARGLRLGRLRVDARPRRDAGRGGAPAIEVTVAATPLAPADHFPLHAAALVPHELSGGLGAHKWADRSPLPDLPAGAEPLLHDRGEVLEAGRANVFALLGDALVTPPLDGRILPGIARAATIEEARAAGIAVREEPLPLAALSAAEAIFLTNSLRGIQPAAPVGGRAERSAGEGRGDSAPAAVRRLAARLRSRWHGGRAPGPHRARDAAAPRIAP